MWLLFSHPEVAGRDCQVCRTYQFDESGNIKLSPTGAKLYRRPPFTDPSIPLRDNEKPPCATCPKIPRKYRDQFKGRQVRNPWRFATDLSQKNQRALLHWQECEAIRWRVPKSVLRDPIVLRNARIISNIMRNLREDREARNDALLQIALTRMMTRPTTDG